MLVWLCLQDTIFIKVEIFHQSGDVSSKGLEHFYLPFGTKSFMACASTAYCRHSGDTLLWCTYDKRDFVTSYWWQRIPLSGSLSLGGGERHSSGLFSGLVIYVWPPENPSVTANVPLRPEHTQGMQPWAEWGTIDRLIRVLFVWIFLLLLFPLHWKYPWALTMGRNSYGVIDCFNCRDLGDMQHWCVCVWLEGLLLLLVTPWPWKSFHELWNKSVECKVQIALYLRGCCHVMQPCLCLFPPPFCSFNDWAEGQGIQPSSSFQPQICRCG